MPTKEQLKQIKTTDRQVAAWNKRATALKEAVESGSVTEAQLTKRAGTLEKRREDLQRKLDAEQPAREELTQTHKDADDRIRRELLELRYEIEEDFAAGRLDQTDYEFCNGQIEHGLRTLDEPRKPGEVRVIGIPRKKPDLKRLARALLMQAEDEARKEEGKPPLAEEEHRQVEADLIRRGSVAEQRRREQADRDEKKRAAAYKRFRSNKPRELRRDTWDWLLDHGIRELPADRRLGRLVYEDGIMGYPELLRSTVIQLEDGVEYIIDSQTVHDLASATEETTLVRLSDRERVPVTCESVEAAIAKGPVFDQLNI